MPTTPYQQPAGTAGQSSQDRVNQLMQSGFTGQMINPATGQMQSMTNGQWAAAPAAAAQPAMTPPTLEGGPQGQQGNPGAGGFLGPGGGAGPSGMMPWNNWMTSGGVNPQGWASTGGVSAGNWQGLGGGPDLSFLQNFNTSGQVTPTDANSLQNAGQSYQDAAYSAATRELDPQWQANQHQFDQQMVNQGLAPGSAAYQTALTNFNNSRNDAYNQARNSSMQQGLAAQQQGFGQGLAQSQLGAQLAQALLGSNTSIANQQLGGNASVTNQLLGGNQALMNALLGGNSGIAQQLIGGQAQMNSANASAGASRFATSQNHDIAQQGLDNNMLVSLLGMGQGQTQYNNGLLNSDQNRNQSFFGYMPQGGAGNIDVQNPYNNYYNGQMNQYGYQQQQANANNNMYANILGSMAGYFFG